MKAKLILLTIVALLSSTVTISARKCLSVNALTEEHDSTADEKLAHEQVTGLAPLEKDSIGWPAHYSGVMLQGFYWNSYDETKWTNLTAKADSVSKYFDLIWVPNAGAMAGDGSTPSMGYLHYKWFDLNSQTFGTADELHSMISTYRKRGTGIIEDVVINHQCPVNDMELFYFPKETYTNKQGITNTYQLQTTDILTDDDGGKTLSEAKLRGKSLSPYGGEEALPEDIADDASNPTTESNTAGLDIDHRSKNVQKMSRALTDMYLHDYGFAGLRYDVAAGYRPEHIVDYNYNSKPRFSIGEVWKQDPTKLNWWLNHWTYTDTNNDKHQVCASFDFPLKYHIINAAFGGNDFSQKTDIFKNKEIINTPNRSRYAVTFTDNHDTYWPRADRSNDDSGPSNYLSKNVLAANAYILAMPGTPCIFLTHYLDPTMQPEIKKMIMARKAAGVTNTSRIIDDGYDPTDLDGYYCVTQGETEFKHTVKTSTTDADGNTTTKEEEVTTPATILFFAGNVNPINLNGHKIDDYTLISEGTNYKFYISNFAVDTYKSYYKDGLSSEGYKALKEKINDASNDNEPITDGDKANHNPEYAAMLPKRTVYVERNNNIKNAPILYVWGSDGKINNYEPLGIWDNGKRMSNDTIINGTKYWYQSFYVNDGYNVIFHNGEDEDKKYHDPVTTSKDQFENISGDAYFRLNDNNGVTCENITEEVLHAGNIRRYTIYVLKEKEEQTAPHLYIKDSDNREINGTWTEGIPTETTTLNGKTYWYHTVTLTPTQTYTVTLHNATADEAKGEGTKVTGLTADIYFSWDDANNTATNITNDVTGYSGHNYTVYVKQPDGFDATKDKAPRLHAWEEGGSTLTADWNSDEQKMTQTTTMNGNTYWYKTFRVEKESFHVILHLLKDKDGVANDSQTQFDGLKSNVYLSWNPTDLSKCANITTSVLSDGNNNKYTVYVKNSSDEAVAPKAYIWRQSDNTALNGAYDSQAAMSDETTRNGITWWYKTIEVPQGDTYSVKLHNDAGEGDTYSNLDHDIFLIWDDATHTSSDTSIYVKGAWKKYTVYVRKDNDTSIAPALHAWLSGSNTQLNGSWENQKPLTVTTTINNATYWYQSFVISAEDKYNVILHNASGQGETYSDLSDDIYLMWDDATHSSSNLTVSVNGKGGKETESDDYTKPYVQRMYTVYVKNDYGWKLDKDHTVHAFVWNSSLAPQYNYSGAWPGQTMTKITVNGQEYFAWSYIGTQTQQPEKVIFNYWDGTYNENNKPNVVQTSNLEFHDNTVYELTEDYNEKSHYDATTDLNAAYQKELFGTSHVVFFQDKNKLGWQNISVSVWSKNDNDKVSYDYAGGHNTAESSETGGERMTPVIMKGQRFYVWNYSGDNKTTPEKIMFHNDAPSKQSNVFDYVEGGLYILKTDGLTLDDEALADATATTESQKVKAAPELVAMNSLFQRTFTPNTYSTICLPFTLTEADEMQLGIKIYKFRGSENNMLTFLRTTDNTKLLCPYLMLYESTDKDAKPKNIFYAEQFAKNTEFADTNVVKTAYTEKGATWDNGSYKLTVGDWTFYGNGTVNTFIKSNDTDENATNISKDKRKAYFGYNAADNTFTWVENGRAAIAPTVCWFEVLKSKIGTGATMTASSKKMDVKIYEDEHDMTTGISEVRSFDSSAPAYNLSGQRVGKNYKGIVIQNGRKILR